MNAVVCPRCHRSHVPVEVNGCSSSTCPACMAKDQKAMTPPPPRKPRKAKPAK
jgi:hypothetical protein